MVLYCLLVIVAKRVDTNVYWSFDAIYRGYVYKDTPYIALRIHINLIPDYHLFIVLANGKYQKGNIAREVAEELGLNMVFIPPYSPNLDLIDRLWKWVIGNRLIR